METILKAYIKETIAAEKAGLEVLYEKTPEFSIAEEIPKLRRRCSACRRSCNCP